MTVSTEERALATYQPAPQLIPFAPGGAPLPTPAEFDMLKNLAIWVQRSGMFPQYKTAEGVMVAMLLVRDMGCAMMLGLKEGYEIKGKVDFQVRAKLASVMGRVPGFKYDTPVWDEKTCTVHGTLGHDDWRDFTYTRAEADAAGYTKTREGATKDSWAREPKLMLLYRTLTRWMTLHAPHVLLGLPPVLVDDHPTAGRLPVEADHEILETGAPVGAGGAQGSGAAAPSAPSPPAQPEEATDHRKAFAAFARKMGKTKNADLLELVRLVFTEQGLTSPKNYSEIAPSDWKGAYEWLAKKYDPATGKPRAKKAAAAESGPAGQPEATMSTAADTLRTDAGPSVAVEEAEEVEQPETPEAEITLPDAEPESPDADDPEALFNAAKGGSPWALVDYAMRVETAFSKAGKPRRFIREHPPESGDFFYVDPEGLIKCGSTKDVNGKPAAASAMLATKQEKYKAFVASAGLVGMLAAAAREALDALEAGQ